jgi:hypothetical protein
VVHSLHRSQYAQTGGHWPPVFYLLAFATLYFFLVEQPLFVSYVVRDGLGLDRFRVEPFTI